MRPLLDAQRDVLELVEQLPEERIEHALETVPSV